MNINPEELLYAAAKNGCVDDMRKALNKHSFPDKQIVRGFELCVQHGHLDMVHFLLPRINCMSKKLSRDTKNLALWWAARDGYSDIVALLLPMTDPSARNYDALRAASKAGHVDCVQLLVEACDNIDHINDAFWFSSEGQHKDAITLLLPKIQPKHRQSLLLCKAVHYANEDAFDILYPLSDPQAALQKLNDEGLTENITMLTARIKIDEEHKIITEQLDGRGNVSKNSKKM